MNNLLIKKNDRCLYPPKHLLSVHPDAEFSFFGNRAFLNLFRVISPIDLAF